MNLINYRIEDRKGYITLNRPEKRNALNPEMVFQLQEIFDIAAKEREVKVVILEAEGDVFCAGADLAYLQKLQQFSYEENLMDSQQLKQLFKTIYTFPKPVIAKVHGHAIAGGCGLATVCDFVYASQEANFGYSEVKIGFVPALVMVFLIRKIGEAAASELLLGGKNIGAEEAKEMKLVHKVSSADLLSAEVEDLANQLVKSNSSESMSLTKALIKRVQDLDFKNALEEASAINAKARGTNDCKTGIDAFLNKKPISW